MQKLARRKIANLLRFAFSKEKACLNNGFMFHFWNRVALFCIFIHLQYQQNGQGANQDGTYQTTANSCQG